MLSLGFFYYMTLYYMQEARQRVLVLRMSFFDIITSQMIILRYNYILVIPHPYLQHQFFADWFSSCVGHYPT
jgi:hypothetical protein